MSRSAPVTTVPVRLPEELILVIDDQCSKLGGISRTAYIKACLKLLSDELTNSTQFLLPNYGKILEDLAVKTRKPRPKTYNTRKTRLLKEQSSEG